MTTPSMMRSGERRHRQDVARKTPTERACCCSGGGGGGTKAATAAGDFVRRARAFQRGSRWSQTSGAVKFANSISINLWLGETLCSILAAALLARESQ